MTQLETHEKPKQHLTKLLAEFEQLSKDISYIKLKLRHLEEQWDAKDVEIRAHRRRYRL